MVSTAQLEQLRQNVEAETGMDLADSRFPRFRIAVERILSKQPSVDLDRLMGRAEEHAAFLEMLVAELTIGESYFFRNDSHMLALRDQVLPDIFRANAPQREMRIWSAGCATGEEPYSLAILIDQTLADSSRWRTSILGTDLNLAFLDRARQARYRQWSFRQTEIQNDRRYFAGEGEWFVLAPHLRNHVRFAYLNLVKDVYPSALTGTLGLDLILFRNVAIYLKPEVTQAIIERFHRALRPGGWLLLGEVELSLTRTVGFETRQFDQATFLQKPAGSPVEFGLPGPFVLPPLRGATSSFRAGILAAPSLPTWGPLPWTGSAPDRAVRILADQSLWERVERCLQSRDFAGSERMLDRVQSARERANCRLRYTRLLIGVAEVERARKMLDDCLRDEPLLLEAQLLKAGIAEETGDLPAAEQACRRALYIDRRSAIAHFHLALILKQMDALPEARRSLETTLQLSREKSPQSLVDYGEGICYGRLLEMATRLIADSQC